MDQSCEIPRWQQLKKLLQNLGPTEFITSFEDTPGAVLLDVRTSQEVEEYALPGAVHLNYLDYDFLDQLDLLDRGGHYYLYCRTGRRSVRAGILMMNWGFKNLVNMEGGLTALEKMRQVNS